MRETFNVQHAVKDSRGKVTWKNMRKSMLNILN
jgi:hypothetical protein